LASFKDVNLKEQFTIEFLQNHTTLYQFNAVHTDETWSILLASVTSNGFETIGELEMAEGGCK